MHTLKSVVTILCLTAAFSAPLAAQDKTLYERLGGKDALTAVVDDFVGRAAADERINKKFAKTDVARLKHGLIEQLCEVTGGPCKYTGRDMKKAHKNMAVTEGEFDALVEDLVATLDQFKVPEKEKNELLGILGPLKGQIVEINSAQTGTALPENFKPAPPLGAQKAGKGKKRSKPGTSRSTQTPAGGRRAPSVSFRSGGARVPWVGSVTGAATRAGR